MMEQQNKMKVVLYTFDQPKWACAHIRLLQYLRQWSSDIELIYGVEFNDAGDIKVNDACVDYGDIFIIQRFFPCPETAHVLKKLFESGKPTIYETDDLLTEILDKHMGKPEHAQIIAETIASVDLVTVSTRSLQEKFREQAKNIIVVPNLIDEGLWVHKFLNKRDTDKLVIGYCGTPTHVGDLMLVEEALLRILEKYQDKVVLRMFGCATEKLVALPNVEYREFSDSYFDFVYQSQKTAVDIAIAPLEDNIFNRCKSNIKWLEYSTREIAGIYSNVGPYKESIQHGETGLLVENTMQDWLRAIELLIESSEQRQTIANGARQYVHDRYSLTKERVDYFSILKKLIDGDVISQDYMTASGMDINLASLDTELDLKNPDDCYQLWRKQRQMSEIDAQIYAERMFNKWTIRPVFELYCKVRGENDELLVNTLQSLGQQLYKDWRLTIIADKDCHIPGLQDLDNVNWLTAESVTDTLNESIKSSQADWVLMFDEGAMLEPNALIAMADFINAHREWLCIYSDHDSYVNPESFRAPYIKPDINREYLYSMDYIGNALAFRREVIVEAGGYREFGAMTNYDMLLRVMSRLGSDIIGHIENVLFHFYQKGAAYNEIDHRTILGDYFERQYLPVKITQGYMPETLRIEYQHENQSSVSIIIPTRDMLEYLQPCVESVLSKTVYSNYELIIVDNGSEDPDVLEFYKQMQTQYGERFRVVEYPFEFNYSAMINLGVEHSNCEYVLQLNNDTVVIQAEWLDRLMHHAQRSSVGIVGAKLLFPGEGRVQHAGVIVGMHDIAGHPYMEVTHVSEPGYMNRTQVDQALSAVTGACLLTRKSVYDEVGGMDADKLKVSYNDIDLCLKVREAGYQIIWTPYSILIHHGSVSQVETQSDLDRKLQNAIRFRGEQETMIDRWRTYIKHDPAYNRQLSLTEIVPQVDYTNVINWFGATKERPRIFGMPVSGGSGEYRVKAPLRALARAGIAQIDYTYSPTVERQRILHLSELVRNEPDAIVVQNFLGDSSIDALEKYRKHTDAFITYALDDLVTNLPEGNEYRKNIPANARTRLRKALKYCDRLIVSTEPLKALCTNMIDDIVVMPNYLEGRIWLDLHSVRGMGPRPRVGWAGAHQHSDDLAFIEEVVKQTAHEVDWVFLGMCPESIRSHVAEIHGFELDFEKYAEKLASLNLDLAIAPLMQHPFNEAKSNLRILEYGAMGWPVICTDIYPYQDASVLRLENDAGLWIEAIRERIHDLDAAYREGDILKQWVMSNFILEQHADAWAGQLLSGKTQSDYQTVWEASRKLVNQSTGG